MYRLKARKKIPHKVPEGVTASSQNQFLIVEVLETEESFARRIELRSIAMDPDGSFSAYFDDDDMFFGHCVTAYGTLTEGVTAANMEG